MKIVALTMGTGASENFASSVCVQSSAVVIGAMMPPEHVICRGTTAEKVPKLEPEMLAFPNSGDMTLRVNGLL